MKEEFLHEPVLLNEVLEHLVTDPAGVYYDATLGLGGHAEAILKSILAQGNKGLLIGTDMDLEALERSRQRLRPFAGNCRLIHGNFRNLGQILAGEGCGPLTGALFDLGISSLQLDKADRGFSIQKDGPLDMRFDAAGTLTAARICNEWPAEQLELLFRENGEVRGAGRMARLIVNARVTKAFETTGDLRDLIASRVPRTGKVHPATQVFMALRIAVNQEFENLSRGLENALPLLKPGGRIAAISFHSLEDRMVKNIFRHFVSDGLCRHILSTPLSPSDAELERNVRARSAKLRVVEKTR